MRLSWADKRQWDIQSAGAGFKNVFIMFSKCSQNVFRMFSKYFQNIFKIFSKCYQNVLKMFSIFFQNAAWDEGNSFSSHAQTFIASCTLIALPSKRQVRGACSGITQVTTK